MIWSTAQKDSKQALMIGTWSIHALAKKEQVIRKQQMIKLGTIIR
jgi:hypothetical protein